MGKQPNVSTNFVSGAQYSGFLTMDSDKRAYPNMPNDPHTFATSTIGVWFYGVTDQKSSYVWSMLTRFVFCQNFKKNGRGKVPCNKEADSFVVIFITSKKTEFFRMSIRQEKDELKNNWIILEQKANISREPNLFFKPFIMKDFKKMSQQTLHQFLNKAKFR